MILSRELKGFKCRFHRNGVFGEGFYACRFSYKRQALLAVLFPGDKFLNVDNGRCAVIDPPLIDIAWRGDDFEPAIRALILAYGDKAFADHQGKSPVAKPPALATPPRSED